ncbi:MAG: hypothetical protein DDT33_01600 [Firmicutes bacterium]|nr:hypothetical protein [Bacillota bacterium]
MPNVGLKSPIAPRRAGAPIAPPEAPPGAPITNEISPEISYPTSLVLIQGITHPLHLHRTRTLEPSYRVCDSPKAGWMKGQCQCVTGTVRWIKLSCKKRMCPICGAIRRGKIAGRIRKGIDEIGGKDGAGWFVGTFKKDIEKEVAVRVQGRFVKWLRKNLPERIEYAVTWEVTKKGRLHINLIMCPWIYIPQKKLSEKWEAFGGGNRVWIKRVFGDIGSEASKSRLAVDGYLVKWEQMVLAGRGVTYSKGWPKLPSPFVGRKGVIEWRWVGEKDKKLDGLNEFLSEVRVGYWVETEPGEWKRTGSEDCDCFERSPPVSEWKGFIDDKCDFT